MTTYSKLHLDSSDIKLKEGFNWAKNQALKYVFYSDKIGSWYEAALPDRESFCMRDVSHQANGAHILGLQNCNYNILYKFAENISKTRDWCSYWEINKNGLPTPVDYKSDTDFWYNLPANFDILDCCYRQYNWTKNNAYINNPVFVNFYDKTVNDYVKQWDINNDGLLEHLPAYGRRGLASYQEGNFNIVTATDLIAAQYVAYKAYSHIQDFDNNNQLSKIYTKKASYLKTIYNNNWWNEKYNKYNSALLYDGTYCDTPNILPLYFDIVEKERVEIFIKNLLKEQPPNVEEMSYYPETLYKYDKINLAYQILLKLMSPNLKRREYPEVSFSIIGAITTGLMGITPQASQNTVSTKSALTDDTEWIQLNNIPIFSNAIDVTHIGNTESILINKGNNIIKWKACFKKQVEYLKVNQIKMTAKQEISPSGKIVSYIIVPIKAGEKIVITIN